MRQILAVAHKTKAFKVVEPYLKENRISDSGVPSSVFISYEGYASLSPEPEYPDYISIDDWRSYQGPQTGVVIDIVVIHNSFSSQLACHYSHNHIDITL